MDQLDRLMEMTSTWFVAVSDRVNINDLLDCRPGQIVRCQDTDEVKLVITPRQDYGVVAGWISDEEYLPQEQS